MRNHHALAVARGAAGVEDVGQLVKLLHGRALVHLFLIPAVGQGQEFVEIEREVVVLVLYDLAVKDNHALQRGAYGQHAACGVILQLLAHEKQAHFGIIDHILHLGGAAGGVEGDGNGAHTVGPEINHQAFGLVL